MAETAYEQIILRRYSRYLIFDELVWWSYSGQAVHRIILKDNRCEKYRAREVEYEESDGILPLSVS